MNRLALALVLAPGLSWGCDSPSKPKADAKTEPAGKQTEPASKTDAEARQEPEPEPMAPAPEGTVALDGIYVHTCKDKGSCPTLLQDAGAAHCKGLTLGGLTWRLPHLAELEGWVGNPDLAGFDGFHWTGSPWDEDPQQWWIFDPGSKSKTTAKPDRKPFTIRCVAEP